MKALALALWLAAIALLVCILRISNEISPFFDAHAQAEHSLMAIAPGIILPQQFPAVTVAEVASVISCSRLGIFPRREWAESVAVILEGAPSSASAEAPAVVTTSRIIEEIPARPWRVQQVRPDAYYLQFDAWDVDELAARMTMQRALLQRLLSINAIPEAC